MQRSTLLGNARDLSRPPRRILYSLSSKKNCCPEKKSQGGSTMFCNTSCRALWWVGISWLVVANENPNHKRKRVSAARGLGIVSRRSGLLLQTKKYFQTIANAYTAWYDCQREISQSSNSTYCFCDPWEADFELPSGAPDNQLDGFLNETWLPGSTCDSVAAQDLLEQFLPNPCEHHGRGYKINELSSEFLIGIDEIWLRGTYSEKSKQPVIMWKLVDQWWKNVVIINGFPYYKTWCRIEIWYNDFQKCIFAWSLDKSGVWCSIQCIISSNMT